ncbi:hypothetical protein JCM11491_004504 [Sporobolomyces phaffii]
MAVRPRTAPPGGPTPSQNLAPDLFVLVRPPPSHSTHALNLQIQLLVPSIARGEPPSARRSGEYSASSSRNGSVAEGAGAGLGGPSGSIAGGNSAVSFDAIAGASVSRSGSRSSDTHDHLQVARAGSSSGETALTRTTSRGSTRSRASTNSVSTSASNSGGTGSRRRVTPLLNLNFHSVLPTVVTDAGTDQRVAKFLKRGIEMSNLAIIDPIDLSLPLPSDANVTETTVTSSRGSPSRDRSASTTPTASANTTPTNNLFTKFKRFTLGSPSPKALASSQPPQQQTPASPSTASSFSLFSRSTSTSSNLSSSSGPHPASPSTSKFLPSLVNSEGAPTPRTVPLLRHGSDDATTASSPAPPGAGLAPSASASAPLGGFGYAFVARKWLRDDLVGISDPGGVPGPNTQIRIEWVRASDQEYRRMGKRGKGRTGARDRSQTRGSDTASSSRRSSEIVEGTIPPVVPEHEELEMSRQREGGDSGTDESGERAGVRGIEDEDEGEGEPDDGESSDPEDSERPFICTLFYPSSSSSSSSSSAPPPSSSSSQPSPPSTSSPTSTGMQKTPSLRRLQLATLRPAPHHPKLIATLLLPPTLPSIPLGSFSPAHGLQGGVLSNETLRDLVHVTSMWISIREGLGGLGRERDSQHIAAGLGLVKVKSSGLFKGLRK